MFLLAAICHFRIWTVTQHKHEGDNFVSGMPARCRNRPWRTVRTQTRVRTVRQGRFRHWADIPETEYLHYVYVERHGLRVSTMLARILKCQMVASKSMAPKFYQRNRNTFARHQRCCDLHCRLWCPCHHVGLNQIERTKSQPVGNKLRLATWHYKENVIIFMYIYIYIYIFICMHRSIHIYIYIYVCMIYIYIYIYIQNGILHVRIVIRTFLYIFHIMYK